MVPKLETAKGHRLRTHAQNRLLGFRLRSFHRLHNLHELLQLEGAAIVHVKLLEELCNGTIATFDSQHLAGPLEL